MINARLAKLDGFHVQRDCFGLPEWSRVEKSPEFTLLLTTGAVKFTDEADTASFCQETTSKLIS